MFIININRGGNTRKNLSSPDYDVNKNKCKVKGLSLNVKKKNGCILEIHTDGYIGIVISIMKKR